MANKPTPAPISKEVPLNEDAVRSSIAAANQRAVAILEQNERVSALALQLNYQGSTDPAVLENSAHDAIRRIGMAIFELGGYLLMLKEACEHGKFLPALERLGMDVDAAQRYMAVSRRFANTASTRHLEGLGITKLVNLLPLTPDTTDVINKDTLARLQPGAYVINVARGAHLVDEDLLAAIDSGHVAGATLDVFRTEPLPAGHPFWKHPRITVTPHTSARTLRDESIAQIARKMVALERGEAVAGVVNPGRGY